MATAFEAVTTRQSWYGGAAISKYDAVEFGTGGKLVKATGGGVFAGICEYGCDEADRMITVVKGTYPCVCSATIAAGDKLTVDSAHAGQFKKATATTTAADAIYGVALNAGAAGELISIAMVEAPVAGTLASA